MLGLGELAIILIVVILVLGAKRLPDLARSAGKSARILKSEVRAMKAENPPPPTAPVTDTLYPVRPGEPTRVEPGRTEPTRVQPAYTDPEDRPPGARPSTPGQ
ncbi:Sec-independent protein translocase subunit TatA [Streptomyces sp. IB2014 016-6]|uniref:Sec-independent protein translocase subunit TatA n=1 Tax=Streptomyces sp. IB2014 016-6 TaxID=2517818 RepID=UPI0011C7D04A|nr:Sec-independent protein translocase subunit TatA [Streptomyces sp. IB2014 016-6]TXL91792.1 Sec-independent protein translocase subunit TatA [Streptomyces sp. IB2014 016-6]